jgi:hypothetical protein
MGYADCYTTASSSKLWDPLKVLQMVNPDRGGITCVGYAPTCRRRCRNPINANNYSTARAILDALSYIQPTVKLLRPQLQKLAAVTLCVRYHQDQVDLMVEKWANMILNAECLEDATPQIVPAAFPQQLPCCFWSAPMNIQDDNFCGGFRTQGWANTQSNQKWRQQEEATREKLAEETRERETREREARVPRLDNNFYGGFGTHRWANTGTHQTWQQQGEATCEKLARETLERETRERQARGQELQKKAAKDNGRWDTAWSIYIKKWENFTGTLIHILIPDK